MKVKKICQQCGKEYEVPHWRTQKSKYCGVDCQRNSLKAKPNVECTICGKPFHLKQSHIDSCKGDFGFCCSKKCFAKVQKIRMSGSGNHQYGLKGSLNASFKNDILKKNNNGLCEMMVYIGDWYVKPTQNGRISEHRYVVELNHDFFQSYFFEKIGDWYYLKDGYEVHHKDFNHSNNNLSNLQILTKSEHVRLHNIARPRERNKENGQFIKNTN